MRKQKMLFQRSDLLQRQVLRLRPPGLLRWQVLFKRQHLLRNRRLRQRPDLSPE